MRSRHLLLYQRKTFVSNTSFFELLHTFSRTLLFVHNIVYTTPTNPETRCYYARVVFQNIFAATTSSPHNKRTHRMTPLSSIKHSHAVYYNHNTCMRVCTIMKSPSVGVFIDTACIICGAWSIKRHGVRPSLSVRQSQHGPTSGLLLWARLQEISIDCCGSGVRIRAVPHCRRT